MKARVIDAVSTKVTILGREYPLKLSANATRQIKKLYGGIAEAGDALEGKNDALDPIDVSIGLVSILATEGARSHNYEHPEEERLPDLPPEVVGTVLTLPEINRMASQIAQAFAEGLERNIVSEDDEKNTQGA